MDRVGFEPTNHNMEKLSKLSRLTTPQSVLKKWPRQDSNLQKLQPKYKVSTYSTTEQLSMHLMGFEPMSLP
jgi:hypothetical protein